MWKSSNSDYLASNNSIIGFLKIDSLLLRFCIMEFNSSISPLSPYQRVNTIACTKSTTPFLTAQQFNTRYTLLVYTTTNVTQGS